MHGGLEDYVDMVEAFSLKMLEELVDGWKKIKTHFQDESALVAEPTGHELLRPCSDVQSSLWKHSALFSSRVTKAF